MDPFATNKKKDVVTVADAGEETRELDLFFEFFITFLFSDFLKSKISDGKNFADNRKCSLLSTAFNFFDWNFNLNWSQPQTQVIKKK